MNSDPLTDLWQEWERLEEEANKTQLTDSTFEDCHRHQAEIEKNMLDLKPVSVEGALALANLLRSHVGPPPPNESKEARLCENLILGLEAMAQPKPGNLNDPVAELGYRYGRLAKENLCFDTTLAPKTHEMEQRDKRVFEEMGVIEKAAGAFRAHTLAGAMFDIIMAAENAGSFIASQLTEVQQLECSKRIERLLYSAVGVLEVETGIRREAFGTDYCMPRGLSPHEPGMTVDDAPFAEPLPQPANDTWGRRAFDAVRHHPAAAIAAALALVAAAVSLENGDAFKGVMAGLFGGWGV